MSLDKICIDFHGVLTNGKINIAADGETKYEAVHVKDISAIRQFIAEGWEVYIVTSSSCPIIDAYCKKVGAVKISNRVKDDLFTPKSYIAIGDSSFDVQFMKSAALAYCPADAERVVKGIPYVSILETKGGEGCIAEMRDHLFAVMID